MPTYATPGVYIEEVTSAGVIAGVATSVAGFVGPARNGVSGKPVLITSWEDFVREFGAAGSGDVYIDTPRSYLAHAIQGFFENGGRVAWVVRVGTDDPASLTDDAFMAGVQALDAILDVSLIAVPDATAVSFQQRLIAHCDARGDRFPILDPPAGLDPTGVLAHRASLDSQRGFGALYYPWPLVKRTRARREETFPVPPSGHLAGLFARVDQRRGVHKAPANEILQGVVGLDRLLTDAQQDVLNPAGVNALRILPGRARPVVWGARTTVRTDLTDWTYVNVRRLAIYIERSIQEGTRWAVFEPNNLALWQKLKRTITEFLTRVWRDGGLFGETAAQAFYVRVDEAINPEPERRLGRLHVEVGFRPSYPAEFVIVRIGLWNGGASIEEG